MTEECARIPLPAPRIDSGYSIEKALVNRHSVREYADEALSLAELAQLLWACHGIREVKTVERNGQTKQFQLRTAPSAGALSPLELYMVAERVEGLEPGIYHYLSGSDKEQHALALLKEGKFSKDLANTANNQACITNAAVSFIIAGVVERTAAKYGPRSERYVLLEVGHAAENVCLQAMSLGVGTVMVGAFADEDLQKLLGDTAKPLYILCMGKEPGACQNASNT